MIDEQTTRVLSSILRVMTTTRVPDEIRSRVSSELLENGFSPAEVTEALGLVETLIEGFHTLDEDETSPRPRALRPPHPREAMKLSEEAIGMLEGWRRDRLLTPEENEAILARVIEAGVGEIEPDELRRIAVDAARNNSLLALYLADPSAAAN
jgi:uncharacterized protein Smg (DUF494 family)